MTSMDFMWQEAIAFNQDLSKWSVPAGRDNHGAIADFLAGRSCGALNEGAVPNFLAELRVGCCEDGAITIFLAACFRGSLSGRS